MNIEPISLLNSYLDKFQNPPSWKQVFSKYAIEFERTKKVSAHIYGEYKSLEDAVLVEDGSLIINIREYIV